MPKPEIKPEINIRLHGIQIMETSISLMPIGFEGVNFNFSVNVEMRIDASRKLVVCVVKSEIKELNKDFVLAIVSIGIGIEVIDFDKVVQIDNENKANLPPQLEAIIKTIAISTARGVIFSELRGTYLHHAYLPIIFNPQPLEKD